jgi:hypothetical protein
MDLKDLFAKKFIIKKSPVFYPYIFAVFPIFFLFAHNIEEVFFPEVLMPSIFILSLTVLMKLCLRLMVKNTHKTGILISVFLIFFFTYGSAYDVVNGFRIKNLIIDSHKFFIFFWCACFIFAVHLIIRIKWNLRILTNFLNIMSFVLFLLVLINISVYKLKTNDVKQIDLTFERTKNKDNNEKETISSSFSKDILRDIYYIILDGYASSSTLKEIYDFNNAEFEKHLISKGFYIAAESRSNYVLTFLSLASSLNMKYVNFLTEMLGDKSKDRKIPYQMISNSEVMNFLKWNGYKFIHFSSGWGATNYNKFADLNVYNSRANEFWMILIRTTLLRLFENHFIVYVARKRVVSSFSQLGKINRIKEPKFVFAHIIPPHPPYIFGADCGPVSETNLEMSGGVWEQKRNYLNQLICINKKVEMLIESILLQSSISPIIIIQSDHGTASTFIDSDSGTASWGNPTEKMIRERTRIFNAYYLPDFNEDEEYIYDSITPVNTFRCVLNYYFDTNYGLLEDFSYYSNYDYPYKFINVTGIAKYD